MLKIRLAQTAQNDLEGIWIYTITEWGEEQAGKYVALIDLTCSIFHSELIRS